MSFICKGLSVLLEIKIQVLSNAWLHLLFEGGRVNKMLAKQF